MPRLITAALFAAALPMGATAQNGQPGLHFVENWDANGDGQVTLAEATEKRGDIFYMFDQDENGSLDDAEYTLFDETRQADMQANAGGHQNAGMKSVNQGMMRDFNDTDGDGLVTQAEFLAHVGDWFAMMDSNGDGVVTTADFSRAKN